MPTTAQNRRQDPRHPHRAHAILVHGEMKLVAHILNLSKHGALIAVLDEHQLTHKAQIELLVKTPEGEITMCGAVAHMKDHYLGIHCRPASDHDDKLLDAALDEINSTVLP